ncbi:DUF4268 domain-containing protein [[Mycoplasma] testudinis]|uniref:DUF4268 domain-containing protein n=1 Tax=[Mycoplasma] testudinis TaxID=33924 RepID=UPI000567CB61|nr:DUF4268 domain-containing protein [[Mycoplasma] testudinis]
MAKVNLKKLVEIKDLTKIWTHEASDFTPWLAEEGNIALLGDAVGLDIEVLETESTVGSFKADILAKEQVTGRNIIIENQLFNTDHDHLGKLITYASGKSASIIIWVVKHARDEHRAAIKWLNDVTNDKTDFFLCEVKLFKIGNSEPAVKFEVIEEPNGYMKIEKKSELKSPLSQSRFDYWKNFAEYSSKNPSFSKNFKRQLPTINSYLGFGIGSARYQITLLLPNQNDQMGVEFYIYDDKELFFSLEQKKQEIEKNIGLSFDWQELPNRKASRIIIQKDAKLNNQQEWPNQFEWLIQTMLKMKQEFKKHL